jgi:O-antigen/teichoic acid export membrane protein
MSRLTKNILWNLAGQAVLLLLGLLAVRLVFKQLGADAFGLILFAQTTSAVLVALMDLGISSAIVREVAAHFESDRAYIIDLMRTSTLLYWSGYLVLVIALLLVAPLLATHWLNLRTIDASSAAQLVWILAAGALLALPRSLYGSLFRGLQEMSVNNLIEVGALALQQLGVIVILALGGGIFLVALWFSASYALSVAAYIVVGLRFVPWRALLPGYAAPVVRRNAGYSGHMMANSALAMVHMQSDKLLVSKLMPIGTLGIYGFAATLAAGVARATTSIVQAAFPSFSDLHARLEGSALSGQYQRVHTLVTVGMAPLFAALVFAGQPVLTYVFSASIAHALMAPLILLCLGWYMNASLSTPYTISLAVGRPQIAARQNFLALFFVLPAAVLLVAGFGLTGAAASWVVYHLFAYAYGPPRIYRECLKLPVSAWYREAVNVGVLIAATYGVAYVLAVWVGKEGLGWLAAAYAIASVLYLLGAYRLGGRELMDAASQGIRRLAGAKAA